MTAKEDWLLTGRDLNVMLLRQMQISEQEEFDDFGLLKTERMEIKG